MNAALKAAFIGPVSNNVGLPTLRDEEFLLEGNMPRFIPEGDVLSSTKDGNGLADMIAGLARAGRFDLRSADNTLSTEYLRPCRPTAFLAVLPQPTLATASLSTGVVRGDGAPAFAETNAHCLATNTARPDRPICSQGLQQEHPLPGQQKSR